jgi:glycosyltransferase involved in cell wall biosynthesis
LKLLISSGLPARQIKNHILPIANLDEVERIFIVRDIKGPFINKVTYYTPPSFTLKSSILKTLFKFFLLLRISIKERPNIVHGYLLFPDGVNVFLASKLTGKKSGVSLVAGPVELFIFGTSPVDKYSYTKPLPRIFGKSRILYNILKGFSIITVTGSFTKRYLTRLNFSKSRIIKLPPRIAEKEFEDLNIDKQFDFITVGRFAKVKHIETILKVVSIIRKIRGNLKVGIFGEGPEEERLKEIAKDLGIEGNVTFFGYKPDVWKWYNKAKLSVIASEREAYPYVAIESLFCGVPVISTKCGDIKDFIKDGYNGILIADYRDAEAFSRAILKLLDNPDLLREFSKNASSSAKKMELMDISLKWKQIFGKL